MKLYLVTYSNGRAPSVHRSYRAARDSISFSRTSAEDPRRSARVTRPTADALERQVSETDQWACGRCVECDGGRGYEFCVSPRGGKAPVLNTDDHLAQTNHRSAYRLYRQALDELAALRFKFEEMREGLELERDEARIQFRRALDELVALRFKFEEMREGLELERDVALRERDEARGRSS